MLSRFDDYPIHQTPEPVAVPASSDRNVYDRYWFNGYQDDGEFYFGIAMGLYPHRGVMDCGLSIVHDGEQHCFLASRRAPREPTDSQVGPFRLEVVEPMKTVRVTLDDNETGLAAELFFSARTACVEEGRQTFRSGVRTTMDVTRFAQFGRWEGRIDYAGRTVNVDATRVFGTKDRSWGIRGVGEPETGGAPTERGTQFFFAWAPLHWPDRCTHFGVFENALGEQTHADGAILPVYDHPDLIPGTQDPDERPVASIEETIEYVPGTRRAARAHIALVEPDGNRHDIDLDPVLCFRMKGIGYGHPDWNHGAWRGELAIGGDRWRIDDLDPLAFENQHLQQVVLATQGDQRGVGVLEQFCAGPHARYGFTDFLDGAR